MERASRLRPGRTILEVARRNDVYIPTLCELNDIDHAPGTCRVCLVEVETESGAAPKHLTACDTAMGENWQVRTRTPRVQEMRQLQMEMIMADHHQDCASCPRNGNCELLPTANAVGLKQVRFHYTGAGRISSRTMVRSRSFMTAAAVSAASVVWLSVAKFRTSMRWNSPAGGIPQAFVSRAVRLLPRPV